MPASRRGSAVGNASAWPWAERCSPDQDCCFSTSPGRASTKTCVEFVERVVDRWQIPTLLVSHQRAEVRRLASQVVLLEAGKVVRHGATADLLGPPSESAGH